MDHIPWLTIALDGLALDECVELLGRHATDQVGPDRRGADRIYGDAEVRKLARQNLRETYHGGFGGGVDRFALQFQRDGHGGEIDDTPVAGERQEGRGLEARRQRD